MRATPSAQRKKTSPIARVRAACLCQWPAHTRAPHSVKRRPSHEGQSCDTSPMVVATPQPCRAKAPMFSWGRRRTRHAMRAKWRCVLRIFVWSWAVGGQRVDLCPRMGRTDRSLNNNRSVMPHGELHLARATPSVQARATARGTPRNPPTSERDGRPCKAGALRFLDARPARLRWQGTLSLHGNG